MFAFRTVSSATIDSYIDGFFEQRAHVRKSAACINVRFLSLSNLLRSVTRRTNSATECTLSSRSTDTIMKIAHVLAQVAAITVLATSSFAAASDSGSSAASAAAETTSYSFTDTSSTYDAATVSSTTAPVVAGSDTAPPAFDGSRGAPPGSFDGSRGFPAHGSFDGSRGAPPSGSWKGHRHGSGSRGNLPAAGGSRGHFGHAGSSKGMRAPRVGSGSHSGEFREAAGSTQGSHMGPFGSKAHDGGSKGSHFPHVGGSHSGSLTATGSRGPSHHRGKNPARSGSQLRGSVSGN